MLKAIGTGPKLTSTNWHACESHIMLTFSSTESIIHRVFASQSISCIVHCACAIRGPL